MVAVVTLASAVASAGESITAEQLLSQMRTYYRGEQLSLLPAGGAALITGGTGAILASEGSEFSRSMGWTLIGFSALELFAGLFFTLRANSELHKWETELGQDPKAFAEHEKAHIRRIVKQFQPILLVAEGVIAATGGVLTAIGTAGRFDTVRGIGVGLAVQGLVFFLFDWLVYERARGYLSFLDMFNP